MDFVVLLQLASAKPIVVSIACFGALFATFGPLFGSLFCVLFSRTDESLLEKRQKHVEFLLVRIGYFMMGLSIALFIVAGFVSDYI